MTVQAIRLAKKSKTFHRNSFRKVIRLLLVSLSLNCVLAFAIYTKFVNLPEPDYYATNGVTSPSFLKAMSHPNYTSKYLLPSEQKAEDNVEMMSYDG